MIFSTEHTKNPQSTATQMELRRPETITSTITTKCILLVNIKKYKQDTSCQLTNSPCQLSNTNISQRTPFVQRYIQSRQLHQSVSRTIITSSNESVRRIVQIIHIQSSIQTIRHQCCRHSNNRINPNLTPYKIKVVNTTPANIKHNVSKAALYTQPQYQTAHSTRYQLQTTHHHQRHNKPKSKTSPHQRQSIPKARPFYQLLTNYQVATKSQLYCTTDYIEQKIDNKSQQINICKTQHEIAGSSLYIQHDYRLLKSLLYNRFLELYHLTNNQINMMIKCHCIIVCYLLDFSKDICTGFRTFLCQGGKRSLFVCTTVCVG
jgi:hypothetical protein